MTPETLSLGALMKWVSLAATFICALAMLWTATTGLAPFLLVLAFLLYFHPVPPLRVTDAELRAWLDGTTA